MTHPSLLLQTDAGTQKEANIIQVAVRQGPHDDPTRGQSKTPIHVGRFLQNRLVWFSLEGRRRNRIIEGVRNGKARSQHLELEIVLDSAFRALFSVLGV